MLLPLLMNLGMFGAAVATTRIGYLVLVAMERQITGNVGAMANGDGWLHVFNSSDTLIDTVQVEIGPIIRGSSLGGLG